MEVAKIGPEINYKQFAIIWSNAADNKMNDFHVEFLNQKSYHDTVAIVLNCMTLVVVCINIILK